MAFVSGTILISGSSDGSLRLWDVATGAPKGNLRAEIGKVVAVAATTTGDKARSRLAFAGDGVRIRQADGSFTQVLGHSGPVSCLAFSQDGLLLASGGSDQTVRIWRVEDGNELRCLNGHTGKVTGVVFRSDGKAVYSASADGTIRFWSWLT